jgi:spermidine synthase
MDGIRYEFVTELPAETVVDLYREGGWWDERWSRKAIPAMIRGSFACVVARDAAGDAVGMGRAISDGASDAYIQDVVVRRDLRGRGIGAEIVRRLTAQCRSRGLDWIGLVGDRD